MKQQRGGLRSESVEPKGAAGRFVREVFEELRPTCDSFGFAFLFWDLHAQHLVKTGPPKILKPLERLVGVDNGTLLAGAPLAESLERAAPRGKRVELESHDGARLVVFMQPTSTPARERFGALIGAGSPSHKAGLMSMLDLAATSIQERYRAYLLDHARREAVRLISNALLSQERAVLLVDSGLRVKLISPAAMKLLGLRRYDLETELDKLVQVQRRELRWYCDGTVRCRQELTITAPTGQLEVAADFHPISFESQERLGTLICIECLVGRQEAEPVRSQTRGFSAIVGKSADITRARQSAVAAAKTTSGVLIEGPRGSGKRFFARAIHHESSRRDGPFVVLDCSAVPSDSIDAQLFGYVDGPLTISPLSAAPGGLELAAGGTLYISEVGMMPEPVQYKLNESIRGGEFSRIGADSLLPINARIIAGSSVSLSEKVQGGEFRGDLYYQLNITRIRLPGLGERPGDIPEICSHFCRDISSAERLDITKLSPKVLGLFMKYDWPGNLDQLREVLTSACISCKKGMIREEHLLSQMREQLSSGRARAASDPLADERRRLRHGEKLLYQRALEITSWNVSQAAKLVGISRASLYRKLSKLGIQRI